MVGFPLMQTNRPVELNASSPSEVELIKEIALPDRHYPLLLIWYSRKACQ